MGGADWVPETVSELKDYVERMRPLMAYNDQTRQFADFLLGTSGDVATTRQQRFESWMGLHGSMMMMPAWARKMTGTYHSTVMERFILRPNEKLKSRLVRWAVGELPCKTMALARVYGAAQSPAVSDTSDSPQRHAA
jgi:uncharacterized protein (DUF2236 family)